MRSRLKRSLHNEKIELVTGAIDNDGVIAEDAWQSCDVSRVGLNGRNTFATKPMSIRRSRFKIEIRDSDLVPST
jgi:hypothetical protein